MTFLKDSDTNTDTADGGEEGFAEEDDEAFDLIEEIIDVFDDFLWENNAKLENKEPKDDWVEPNLIYGHQRDDLTCRLFERLVELEII